MKVLILCGGDGLRIKGNFNDIPKPLIPINGKPLLSYIIELYQKYSFKDFILLVGNNSSKFKNFAESHKNLNINVLETGLKTSTGGRILRAKNLLGNAPFFLTYGDGVSDVDINLLLKFHLKHKLIATLTAVKPQLPFGLLKVDVSNKVNSFEEKPVLEHFVNGGFFVLNKEIFDFLNDDSDFENEILPQLSRSGQLCAFSHSGFWRNMDTYKDYLALEEIPLEKTLFRI